MSSDAEASIGLLLLFQLVLIFLNAVFASAEIAVLSISEAKLEHMAEQGSAKAKRLYRLAKEPARFLATIQVAITLSGFLGSAFAADNFSEPLVKWLMSLGVTIPRHALRNAAVVMITLVLSYVTLIFGELVPKRIAMKKSEQIALGVSGLISFISVAFKPVVWLLSVSTNFVLRLMGIDPDQPEGDISEEEIRMMVDAGSEKGAIDHQEKEFIQNVFEFNDIIAGEIATHRTDVTLLMANDPIEAWDRIIHESRHTRYPVCDGSADNITGILNAKDYFRIAVKTKEKVVSEAVHAPYFVPETIKADVLFRDMKSTHNSLAVVLDEYGGMVGIVTINDLIEELVGELNDEPSRPENQEPKIEHAGRNSWRISGNVELCDLEEATGFTLSSDDYDTLTGLVFDKLGMIPADGPQDITLELDRLLIHIDRIDAHQIASASVALKPEESAAEEAHA